MASGPTVAALEVAGVERRPLVRPRALADYWALTKPEVNLLIAITTCAGFCLALSIQSRPFPFVLLAHTLLGTLLVAAGTGTLNQYVERRYDARMRRTARRPLAAGRLEPLAVLQFGILLSCAGGIYLAVAVNALASLLAVLTLTSYLFLYTPLKRKTPLCVLVGAFPGAMPPLIGWAAASGRLSLVAWVLYGIVFFWQFPALHGDRLDYRQDHARAGYLVLPFEEQRDCLHGLAKPCAVPGSDPPLPDSNVPWPCRFDLRGWSFAAELPAYDTGARLALRRSNATARRLLFASILYLHSYSSDYGA